MKMKFSLIALGLILFASSSSYGQVNDYNYKRAINGIADQWHKIALPDEIFGKVTPSLSDIRIVGVTENNDTIETPYLIRVTKEQTISKQVDFETINRTNNESGYYYTFEVPTQDAINQIDLDFGQENFDWRVTLEASINHKEWFTVVENYRILSIQNELTDYQFTKVAFPSSKFQYFRWQIKSAEQPTLILASLSQNEIVKGNTKNYAVKNMFVKENKELKQSEIIVKMEQSMPVSLLRINVLDTFDYYRSMTIQYLSDSVETEKGWFYNYNTLVTETLTSIDERIINFRSVTTSQIKVIIHNQDNAPLNFGKVEPIGYVHELIARFIEPAQYFLVYGNSSAKSPRYDIAQFEEKIPLDLKSLTLGEEVIIEKAKQAEVNPLFENEMWLWAVLITIITVLGWFSVKMIGKK